MKPNVLMIGADYSAVDENSFLRKVLSFAVREWRGILILAPRKGRRGFVKVMDGVWYYYFPSYFHLLLFALSRHNIPHKVMITMDVFLYGLAGYFLKNKGVWVAEMHSQTLFNRRWFNQRLRNKVYYFLGRWLAKKADKIRAVYPDRVFFKHYKNAVHVPSNYTITDIFRNQNYRKTYDVIYVGRLHPQKNITYIISLMFYLKEKGLSCLIVGKGDKKYGLMIKKHGIKHIEWLEQKDLSAIYAKSKVVLFASPAEGGPRAAFEALACGCLVATTPTGLIKDVLINNTCCGVLIEGKDVIIDAQQIIKVVQNYKFLAKCCNFHVKDFEEVISEYVGFINELLKQVNDECI